MRRLVLVAGILACAAAPSAHLAGSPTKAPAETIELGSATLHLGMSQQAVLDALGEWHKVEKFMGEGSGSNASWLVSSRSAPFVNIGTVAFKDGKLSTVVKNWGPSDQQRGVETASAVYGAIAQLVHDGTRSCIIDAGTKQSPTADMKTASLFCGRRLLEISVVVFNGEPAATVTEYLRASN